MTSPSMGSRLDWYARRSVAIPFNESDRLLYRQLPSSVVFIAMVGQKSLCHWGLTRLKSYFPLASACLQSSRSHHPMFSFDIEQSGHLPNFCFRAKRAARRIGWGDQTNYIHCAISFNGCNGIWSSYNGFSILRMSDFPERSGDRLMICKHLYFLLLLFSEKSFRQMAHSR